MTAKSRRNSRRTSSVGRSSAIVADIVVGTLYRWEAQGRIDHGQRPEVSKEQARIRELEAPGDI
jgi:hypothetical protein